MDTELIDLDLLPSAEDVRFYHEHGWYISKKILPKDLVDAAADGAERYYAGERDWELTSIGETFNWKPENGDVLRLNAYVALQNTRLRNLVRFPIIGAIAARLAGTSTIRLFRDQLIHKPPQERGRDTLVGWHVDRAYWMTCTSKRMLTAWVPFHDVDTRMGTLVVVDGSHRWPATSHLRTFGEQDLEGLMSRIDSGGNPIREVPLHLTKGQVSFHHCCTIHGSRANQSAQARVSLAIHMQDGENRYRPFYSAEGRQLGHLNDALCRKLPSGLPDYSDPEICPTLWPISQ